MEILKVLENINNFNKKYQILKVASEVVNDVEENNIEDNITSDTKLNLAVKGVKAIIDRLGVKASETEVKDIIEGLVASYNITGRFFHKEK
jgi:hypothetical protein